MIGISKTWYQLRAVEIFVEHIVTNFDETEQYARRLQLVSSNIHIIYRPLTRTF